MRVTLFGILWECLDSRLQAIYVIVVLGLFYIN